MPRLARRAGLFAAAATTLVGLATLGHVPAGAKAGPVAGAAVADQAARCAALTGKLLSTGRIETSNSVTSGDRLVSEPLGGMLAALNNLKATAPFCRVRARLHPSPDSDILVEAWLPENWNGKLLGVGGGGFSGGYATAAITLRVPLEEGYAVVATDVGHPATETAEWAFGHPEKLKDYAYRGNHLAAVTAKEAVRAFYGTPASRAYFQGCSNGGRDALMEVSRFPSDYDGVIAGAPAARWTPLMTSFLATRKAIQSTLAAGGLAAKLDLINKAVLAKCDARDGVSDGVLEDPRQCRFDPAELQCKPGASADATCLSPSEVFAARTIYRGSALRSGKRLMDGFSVGGETSGWDEWITSSKTQQNTLGTEFFRWIVHGDLNWSLGKFDADRDMAAARQSSLLLDSANPDIRAFVRRGGKLILYHGWNDAAIPPLDTVRYFQAAKRQSDPAGKATRLFMAPGMGHCFAGPGPNTFDLLPELDGWVEQGRAPERVIATKYPNNLLALLRMPQKPVRSRPLCAWPRVAKYKGAGSTDDAANFSCELPGKQM